jgi:hypothetical protein
MATKAKSDTTKAKADTTTKAKADTTQFKPGQSLVCTIEKLPRTEDQESTLARLMRKDPANKRALRRAQRMRRQRMIVYNRGNRDWYSREKSAHVVRVAKGQSWTMPFTLDLAGDLATVGAFVSVKAGK